MKKYNELFLQHFYQKLFSSLMLPVLTEAQKKVVRVPNLSNRNVIMVFPCGSGKTEASYYIMYRWRKRNKRRSAVWFYVLPQKTLANSLVERLSKYNHALKEKDLWTLQHSSSPNDPYFENPFIVTTIDQVLNAYYGFGKEAFMKGKKVVQGYFIFDEIQLFEPGKALLSTISMLKQIQEMGGKFCIMTATMPQYLINFLAKEFDMEVLIADNPSIENREVTMHYSRKLPIHKIKKETKKQVIICNTVRQVERVAELINDPDRCIILNGRLQDTDRKEREKEAIKYFGKESSDDHNKILIATSVIEAGIDLSTPIMYSAMCAIDSLIQRDGRIARWGGIGTLIVFDEVDGITGDSVYDDELIYRTREYVKKYAPIKFSWSLQKQWVTDIMNPYYERFLNKRSLIEHLIRVAKGSSRDLIRDMDQVNIVVANDINEHSDLSIANKESVSVYRTDAMNKLKNLPLYRIEKKELVKISAKDIKTGDTIIYDGSNAVYDEIGFRFKEGCRAKDFYDSKTSISKTVYSDYIEEPWIVHAIETNIQARKILLEEEFHPYVMSRIDALCFVMGLHDIGKLDEVWNGDFAGYKGIPLAHFPFKKGVNPAIFKDRNHAVIGAIALKEALSDPEIYLNLILQHHKRYIPNDSTIYVSEYKFIPEAVKAIEEYINHFKFPSIKIKPKGKNEELLYEVDVINPTSKRWALFVYLAGTLMEADRNAIEEVKKRTVL